MHRFKRQSTPACAAPNSGPGPTCSTTSKRSSPRAKRFDLSYALHFPTRRDLSDAHLKSFVALYRALSCRSATIHQLEYDYFATAVQKLDPGLCLAVENSYLDVPAFHRWAEVNPSLTLDVEHVWFLTMPESPLANVIPFVAEFLAHRAAKVRHVHMPGYTPGMPDHQPMYTAPEFVTAIVIAVAQCRLRGLRRERNRRTVSKRCRYPQGPRVV